MRNSDNVSKKLHNTLSDNIRKESIYKFMLFQDGMLNKYDNLQSLPSEIVKNVIVPKYILLEEVQVPKFLRLVAEGEQERAEAMLQQTPELSLCYGNVTDLSQRRFNNITGFQYAVWALDWHMWTMLHKYLEPTKIKKQLNEMADSTWAAEHGEHASWQNLIDALDRFNLLCKASKYREADAEWIVIGDAQQRLPAHVVNEYCHPNRPFYPCPNFNDPAPIPQRIHKVGSKDWFGTSCNRSILGIMYAFCRGHTSSVSKPPPHGEMVHKSVRIDRAALHELLIIRKNAQKNLFLDFCGENYLPKKNFFEF